MVVKSIRIGKYILSTIDEAYRCCCTNARRRYKLKDVPSPILADQFNPKDFLDLKLALFEVAATRQHNFPVMIVAASLLHASEVRCCEHVLWVFVNEGHRRRVGLHEFLQSFRCETGRLIKIEWNKFVSKNRNKYVRMTSSESSKNKQAIITNALERDCKH